MSDERELSCPRCAETLRAVDYQGIALAFCRVCRGGLTSVDTLAELLGHPLEGAAHDAASLGDMDECARCASPMIRNERPETTWMSCASCDGAWLEAGVVSRIHAARPPNTSRPPSGGAPPRASHRPIGALTSSAAPPSGAPAPPSSGAPAVPAPASSRPPASRQSLSAPAGDGSPLADRLSYDHPLVQYLSLPIAALLGIIFGVFGVARVFVFMLQVQFHEIGHAVPAWLSSRAALPLPFGFTFWREESSWITAVCVLFLIGVLAVTSFRERRHYGVAAAAILLAFWAYLTLVLDAYSAIGWILFGGLAGELLLSTAAIVSFYYRAPDRLRWDFWRFFLLVPAAVVFASSFTMWVRIDMGAEQLPLGSIIGAPGDGTGDIERMMAGYGWTGEALTATFRSIGVICLLVIAAHYVFFAIRARVRSARAEGDRG